MEDSCGVVFLISEHLSPAEMFNNSYAQLPTMSTSVQANGRDPSTPSADSGYANGPNDTSFPRPEFQVRARPTSQTRLNIFFEYSLSLIVTTTLSQAYSITIASLHLVLWVSVTSPIYSA